MDMDFSAFLGKMSDQTSGRKKPEQIYEEKRERPQRIEKKEKPAQKHTPKVEEVEDDFNDDYSDMPEQKIEQQNTRNSKTSINEEFLDRAYDYAQGVIKVIRNNFKTTEERAVMLESLQKAINHYLANIGVNPVTIPQVRNESITPQRMSESQWNSMPQVSYDATSSGLRMNNLTGQEIKLPSQTGAYNPKLNLGIKIAPNGKQEVDLSGVTQNDINEMKMLAGMIGPEAEQKKMQPVKPAANNTQFSPEAMEEIARATRDS